MKKLLCLILALVMVLSLAACGNKGDDDGSADGYELALVTDLGTIDDKSFNQGAWEGLVAYAEANNISHKYYQPTEQSDDAYLTAIELAVTGGAKVIVTPGYLFETPVYLAQDLYPDVCFVLIDGNPHDADGVDYKTADNTVGITYAEEEAGFLAGYAAVIDGYRSLGFMGGMAVPAVIRYGHGFVQGAEYAAAELGLSEGDITINYHYTGGFDATPEVQAMAASWYNDGIEIIFGCGGAVGNSVMTAAEAAGAAVIGVDVDQSSESDSVVISAMKGLAASVYSAISDYYSDSFPGGQNLVFNAAVDGVGLSIESSKLANFTSDDYDLIYIDVSGGSISILGDTDADGNSLAADGLGTSYVSVTVIN